MKQTMSATLATSQFHHEIGDALQNAMRVQKALHVKRNLLADMNTYTRLPPPPLQKTVSLPPALPSARSTLNAVPSIDNNNNYSIYSDPIALSSSSLSSTTSDSPQQSPSSGSQQLNSSRYKTELCRSHAETGDCKYGEKCQFAHGVSDLRDVQRHPKYKTELCRSYHSSAAYCQYGNRCNFIHREDKRQATAQQNISAVGAQRPQTLPHDLEIGIFDVSMVNNMPQRGMSLGSTGDSPAGSIAAESPTASPTWPSNSDYFNSPLLSQSPPSVNYMQSPEPYVFSDAQTVVEPQRSQQYMSALPTQKTTPNTDDINELAASLSRAASLRTNTDSFVGPYGPHVLPPSPTTSSADREVANLTPVEVDIALQYLNNLRQLERRPLPSQQYPFA